MTLNILVFIFNIKIQNLRSSKDIACLIDQLYINVHKKIFSLQKFCIKKNIYLKKTSDTKFKK